MKKYQLVLALLSLIFIATGPVYGQGKIFTKAFYSTALNDTMNYNIYLPDNYTQTDKEYPLFLLLHGYTGNHTDWKRQGDVDKTINRLINNNESKPMIIVMPDAGNSWYVDSDPETGWGHYETAIIRDLFQHIENIFPVSERKNSRYIAGLSMGGYGALHLAFKYPNLFKASSSMSAAYMQKVPENYTYLENTFGDPLNREKYQKESPFNLASKDTAKHMPVYITCGDDDLRLFHYSVDMYDTLTARNYPVELRITDGAHTWDVWAREIENVIKFFNQ